MASRRRFAAARVIVATIAILGFIITEPASDVAYAQDGAAVGTSSADIQLCVGSDGRELDGGIDIFLLIDDSASLRTQDPLDRRFDAMDVLLSGLVELMPSSRSIEVAAAMFGSRYSTVFGFEPLTAASVGPMMAQIRAANPGDQMLTDYELALDEAASAFSSRSASRCRILLWFTDGNHDVSDRYDTQTDEREAAALRAAACSGGQLVSRLRDQRVNTFVLLLAPPGNQPARLEASKDVMQVLTGDSEPGFPDEPGTSRAPSGACEGPLDEQLGLVLPAAEADQLPGLFADLPNRLDGGREAAPQRCPYVLDEIESSPLPDGHLVDWFSLTSYSSVEGSSAPTLANLQVVSADGETLPSQDALVTVLESGPTVRFRPAPEALDAMHSGWRLRVVDADQLCLRVRPVRLAFQISTADPQLTVLSPANLPARLWDAGQLRLLDDGGQVVDLATALQRPSVNGRLAVDNGQLFTSTGTLPADISIVGAPALGEGCRLVEVPAAGSYSVGAGGLFSGKPEAPTEALHTSTCTVTPASRGEDGGVLDFALAVGGLNRTGDACGIGQWSVWVDGSPIESMSLELPVGGAAVTFGLRSAEPPDNEQRECLGVAMPPVALTWQGETTQIPLLLSAEWVQRGDTTLALLMVAATLLVAVLASFGLLWLLNWLLIRSRNGAEFWVYETSGELVVDSAGQGRLEFSGGGAVPAVAFEHLSVGRGGGREPLEAGSSRLVRVMPGLLTPLRQPSLVIEYAGSRPRDVAAEPAGPVANRLPVGFERLAVATSDSELLDEPGSGRDERVPVRLTVLVPQSSDLSGAKEVTTLLSAVGSRLAQQLARALVRRRQASKGEQPPTKRGGRGGPGEGSGPRGPRSGGPRTPSGSEPRARPPRTEPGATPRPRPHTGSQGSSEPRPRPRSGPDNSVSGDGRAPRQPRPRPPRDR